MYMNKIYDKPDLELVPGDLARATLTGHDSFTMVVIIFHRNLTFSKSSLLYQNIPLLKYAEAFVSPLGQGLVDDLFAKRTSVLA